MPEVLSKDEIDRLLAAINAGHTEPEKAAVTRKFIIYDFKRPDKFSKEQLITLSIIHETFARLTTARLSALLRSMVHVHVASIDQLTYEEFTRSVPTPTTLGIINLDPIKGNAVMEIDPAITFSIIDRLFGGFGEGTKFQHVLTDIEESVMEGIIVRLLENMREAWTTVIDLHPRLIKIETNPQLAQVAPPNEMVVLVTMEAKVGEVEGMINICIPYLTLEPVIDRLSALYGGWNSTSFSKKYTLANRKDIPVKLTAEIIRRGYSLGEIKDWKEGTYITPSCHLTPDHCYLSLGDKRVWYCKTMKEEINYPKKIEIESLAKMPFGAEDRRMEMSNVNSVVANALELAKVTVSVELGTTALTVKEVFCIKDGTVLELDKLAGEPVDVKANGVLIAKGEVVVIDENFGVRILETIGTLNPFAKQETPAAESQE